MSPFGIGSSYFDHGASSYKALDTEGAAWFSSGSGHTTGYGGGERASAGGIGAARALGATGAGNGHGNHTAIVRPLHIG